VSLGILRKLAGILSTWQNIFTEKLSHVSPGILNEEPKLSALADRFSEKGNIPG